MRNKPFDWTEEKLDRLRQIYSTYSKEDILSEFSGISWHALVEYARKRGIYRGWKPGHQNRKTWYRSGDLSALLLDEVISYYWIGYILADGWISPAGQVVLVSSEKDKQQLDKFAKFIKSNNRRIDARHSGFRTTDEFQYRVAVQDRILGPQIAQKFSIDHQKTYNPPKPDILNTFSNDLKIALLIGFIDGDGSRNSSAIVFDTHSSWVFFIQELLKVVDGHYVCSINKRGYLHTRIGKNGFLQLQKFAEENNLPVLERKWN